MDSPDIPSVSKEQSSEVVETELIPTNCDYEDYDFVELFPPELSNKLFAYVSDKDLFTCSKCSISWQRVINNDQQWKRRCIRRRWVSDRNEKKDPNKWKLVKSHIPKDEVFRFRSSPAFSLDYVPRPRIPPLCSWALYFRQCLHLLRNWTMGIYSILRMKIADEEDYYPLVINATDCNGSILATGTYAGQVLLWSVEGVPKYLRCIWPMSRRTEVEAIRLTSKYLIILYNIGLMKIFNAQKEAKTEEYKFELLYEVRGIGSHSQDGFEFNLNTEYLPVDDIISLEAGIQNEEDVELWIRDLFRAEFWFGNDDFGSDMMIYTNEEYVVLTALLCKSFILWDIHTGSVQQKTCLKPGFQVFFEVYPLRVTCHLENFISLLENETRKPLSPRSPFLFMIFMNRKRNNKIAEISSESVIEETRPDSKDERIAYTTQDGTVRGMCLINKRILFTKNHTSFVDNLAVSDECIVYHQYNGRLVGLNWDGDTLYQIEAHMGVIRGLKCFGNLLVSGGDAMQLSVWNVSTGEKLYTVHRQPCKIQYVYVDETKIVTVGREDHPVLIGYW